MARITAVALACGLSCAGAFQLGTPALSNLNKFHGGSKLFMAPPDSEVSKTNLGSEKIIYDPRSGRFFEKNVEEVCRDEYCAIDESTGEQILLTREEKERIFLDALQSFYFDQEQLLSDEDFDQLKADLVWEGSPIATMNRDETLFLNAMSAYKKGEPIITDEEFDTLKSTLKEQGSKIYVSQKPRCYIDTGICTSTFAIDETRNFVIYMPAAFLFASLWLGLAYEILEPLKDFNPFISMIVGAPLVWVGTREFIRNVFFKKPLVVVGPCPNCGFKNRAFFGDVLGVDIGSKESTVVTCQSCKAQSTIERRSLRASYVPEDK